MQIKLNHLTMAAADSLYLLQNIFPNSESSQCFNLMIFFCFIDNKEYGRSDQSIRQSYGLNGFRKGLLKRLKIDCGRYKNIHKIT